MTARHVEHLELEDRPHSGRAPAIPKRLLLKGWSKEPVDFCWMDCANPGHHLKLPSGWEITLCSAHMKQLDRAAEEAGGYSKAAPPPHSKAAEWPWSRWAKGRPINRPIFRIPA
jgi:hypothetical protein